MIKSRLRLMLLVVGVLTVVNSVSAVEERPHKTNQAPNILFFLADDMGWTDLGCYGSSFYESPTP